MTAISEGSGVAAFRFVRPTRAAVLVPLLEGVPWRTLMRGALRAQCLTWGGESNIPVPWDAAVGLGPLQWRLLGAIDPDVIAVYAPTAAELRDLDEAWYLEWEQATRAENAGIRPESLDMRVNALAKSPLISPVLPDDLLTKIAQRCSLFGGASRSARATSKPHGLEFPFTPIRYLRGDSDAVMIRRFNVDSDLQLLLAATCGDVPDTALEPLRQSGYDIGATELQREDVLAAMLGPSTFAERTVWHLTRAGLSWLQPASRMGPTPTVVVGDTPEDFALAYALQRLQGAGWWASTALADDDHFLALVAHHGERFSDLTPDDLRHVTSVSSQQLAADTAVRLSDLGGKEWTVVGSSALWKHGSCRLAATNPSIETIPLIDGETAHLDARWPDVEPSGHEGIYWTTEVVAPKWLPISDGRLSDAILNAPGYASGRTTRVTGDGGFAYLCPHFMRMGPQDFAAETVRPQLRILSLHEQVQHLLGHEGWTSRLSDKGLYATASWALFGGETRFAETIDNSSWWHVLQAMANRPGSLRDIDFFDLRDDRRRYVTASAFAQLRARTGLPDELPQLVSTGILQRGLIHKCAVCRWTGWFDALELGERLRCSRCRNRFDLRSEGWMPAAEPQWHYRIPEVLWQFIEHDGDIPNHAISRCLGSPVTVDALAEIEIFDPAGVQCELDICAAVRGELWIGEAKRASTLGGSKKEANKTLSNIERVAGVLRPRGIIFATGSEAWTSATTELIRARFADKPYELRIEACPPHPLPPSP